MGNTYLVIGAVFAAVGAGMVIGADRSGWTFVIVGVVFVGLGLWAHRREHPSGKDPSGPGEEGRPAEKP